MRASEAEKAFLVTDPVTEITHEESPAGKGIGRAFGTVPRSPN
jgi:hypothetical protein